jgi:dihydrofolate reductase
MILSHIVAVSKNYVIGKNNALPWKLPADMQYFKKTTENHVVIMGRKNFEAEGKPLPNRTNIVISKQNNYIAPGCMMAKTIEEAIKLAEKYEKNETFIVGGGEIYNQTLPLTDKLYITMIDMVADGDVYYALPDMNDWKLISQRFYAKDKRNSYNHTYYIYQRKTLMIN